ncbi:MAG: lipoprotein [Anaerosolibacter sp.]|uniref:ABC transporter substrate-binding protein n=1 Tax=Anaerosolibacter sp. TaxID=1872527 RepID=UPI00261376EB|nr:ABC transporter substrate-binding protein [Anaerosolibacter sp.]MDF2547629.1 lipoprotein [Anaerosolibacter sp.]
MKKYSVLLTVLIALGLLVTGCGSKPAPVETPPEEAAAPIKFATLPAESAIPLIIAKEKGFFEEEGVNIELVPFNSPNDRNVAVQAGQIDGMIADVMTSLTFHEAGFGMKITSDINEDFKLLTSPNSGIDTFDKLNNKDVSIIPNLILEYIMDEMAEKNGISYEIVAIPSIPARFEALMADQVSAVVFTEPQATLLASRGAKVLAGSKEYGLKAGTLLFSEKIIAAQPKGLKGFYNAYNKAVDYINETDASEYGQILTSYGFPDAVVSYLNSDVTYEKARKITDESFADVLEWAKAKEMIKETYELKDVSDFSFIE